jgi:hypothetical protein
MQALLLLKYPNGSVRQRNRDTYALFRIFGVHPSQSAGQINLYPLEIGYITAPQPGFKREYYHAHLMVR